MMKTPSKGFTLIELMVALTISLIVAAALTQVYAGTRQTNRVQEMQSRLTEDGRFALSMLQRVISQAGFRPTVNGLLTSDRILATSGTSITVKFTGDGTNIVNCNGAAVAANTATSLVITTTGNTLTCTDASAANWIAPATGGNGTEVVDFQIQYGIDTAASPTTLENDYRCGTAGSNRDCVADDFVTTLPTSPFVVTAEQVVAVKVCLMLRTEMTDTSIVKPAALTNCSGTNVASSDSDKKLYRTFQTTILLKNR